MIPYPSTNAEDRSDGSGKGVRTETWSKHRLRMVTQYVSVADPIGSWLLRRDMEKRIAGVAKGCSDPVVITAVS